MVVLKFWKSLYSHPKFREHVSTRSFVAVTEMKLPFSFAFHTSGTVMSAEGILPELFHKEKNTIGHVTRSSSTGVEVAEPGVPEVERMCLKSSKK